MNKNKYKWRRMMDAKVVRGRGEKRRKKKAHPHGPQFIQLSVRGSKRPTFQKVPPISASLPALPKIFFVYKTIKTLPLPGEDTFHK
jgi:hypothetical protein